MDLTATSAAIVAGDGVATSLPTASGGSIASADGSVVDGCHRETAPRGLDVDAAERACRQLLWALGLDLSSEAVVRTPHRMARAFAELLTAPEVDFTTFPNEEGYDELVLVEDIPFRSLCEHHMLPFAGVAHVGYLPGSRILGLSKLARLVAHAASRPQTQERLTTHVAEELDHRLRPRGVGVVLHAQHACMSLRGARAHGTWTRTSSLSGELTEDPARRAEFLSLTRSRGGATP